MFDAIGKLTYCSPEVVALGSRER